MDELALTTLRDELLADCQVAEAAWSLAQTRFDEQTDSGLEACAHYLSRLYNVIEQMGVRVARAFENRLEDDRGWHAELIRRLSIPISGVRPALFAEDIRQPLRELRAFRHVFTHAYDLELERGKLALLLTYAERVVPRLRPLSVKFVDHIARQEGLSGFE